MTNACGTLVMGFLVQDTRAHDPGSSVVIRHSSFVSKALTNLFHNNGAIPDYNTDQHVELGELSGLDDFRTEPACVPCLYYGASPASDTPSAWPATAPEQPMTPTATAPRT
jgi:hypothetical protein